MDNKILEIKKNISKLKDIQHDKELKRNQLNEEIKSIKKQIENLESDIENNQTYLF